MSCPWVSSMNGLVAQGLFFWRQLEQLQEASVLGRLDCGKKKKKLLSFGREICCQSVEVTLCVISPALTEEWVFLKLVLINQSKHDCPHLLRQNAQSYMWRACSYLHYSGDSEQNYFFLKATPTSRVGTLYSVLTEEIFSLVHTDETQTVEHITVQHTWKAVHSTDNRRRLKYCWSGCSGSCVIVCALRVWGCGQRSGQWEGQLVW